MLLLFISLLSCCFSGSTASATKEFQANFRALVALTSKESEEIYLPVPPRKFQCSHVPCQLESTVRWLKDYLKNDQTRAHISRMEKNMANIISTLNKAHMKPKTVGSCPYKEVNLQSAPKHYENFFQNLHENC